MSDEIWNEACRESRENNCEGCKSRDEMIQTLSKRIDELETVIDRPRPILEPAAIDWGW